jgi:hypothetical protein
MLSEIHLPQQVVLPVNPPSNEGYLFFITTLNLGLLVNYLSDRKHPNA